MKKYFWIGLILVATLLLPACSASATPSLSHSEANFSTTSQGIAPVPAGSGAGGGAVSAPIAAPVLGVNSPASNTGSLPDMTASGTAASDRIVINNADLKIVVKDPAASMDFITNLASKMNGWVVSSNLYKTTTDQGIQVPEATITIRVDAQQLDNAIKQIKAQVSNPQTDVLSETVTGQDVTKEYTDLNSRLTNLQKAEAQLQEIMASASKTEDVLTVYNQLTQIREQIEVIQGQINYYKESAAYSAISVTLTAQASVQPLQIGGWQPAGVARNALQSLISALQFLGSAAIWILLFLAPIAIVIFIPLWILWKLLRRFTRRKAVRPAAVVPTPPTQP